MRDCDADMVRLVPCLEAHNMTNTTKNHADRSAQPVLFMLHGAGPCFFMDWDPPGTWDGMADFLKGVAATLPARPRAILMVAAGAAGADSGRKIYSEQVLKTRLSAYRFG